MDLTRFSPCCCSCRCSGCGVLPCGHAADVRRSARVSPRSDSVTGGYRRLTHLRLVAAHAHDVLLVPVWLTDCVCSCPIGRLRDYLHADVVGDATKQQSQVGAMELGRGRSRPPWRDASGEGGLWPLCQAVYAVTIPTRLRGVVGTAIPTSRAFLRPRGGWMKRKGVFIDQSERLAPTRTDPV